MPVSRLGPKRLYAEIPRQYFTINFIHIICLSYVDNQSGYCVYDIPLSLTLIISANCLRIDSELCTITRSSLVCQSLKV